MTLRRFSVKEVDWEEEKTTVKGRSVRALAIITSVVLAIYWACFALESLPWFVQADSDRDYVRAYSNAAKAGFIMCIISIASTVMATGALARTCFGWGLSAFLLGCMAVASVGLYPQLEAMQLSPFRFPAQLASAAVIVLGAVGFWLPSDKKIKITREPPIG